VKILLITVFSMDLKIKRTNFLRCLVLDVNGAVKIGMNEVLLSQAPRRFGAVTSQAKDAISPSRIVSGKHEVGPCMNLRLRKIHVGTSRHGDTSARAHKHNHKVWLGWFWSRRRPVVASYAYLV